MIAQGFGPGAAAVTQGLGPITAGAVVTAFVAGEITFTQASRGIAIIMENRALTMVQAARNVDIVASLRSMSIVQKTRSITFVSRSDSDDE